MIKKLLIVCVAALLLSACGGRTKQPVETPQEDIEHVEPTQTPTPPPPAPDASQEAEVSEDSQPTAEDYVCIPGVRAGKITKVTNEQELKALYLPENVRTEEVPVGEGNYMLATRIFPDTPQEIIVFWKDGDARKTPERVVFEQENSPWKTHQGVTVGTTAEELERLNGKPFKLYGFEWDYAGNVSSWEGGALGNPDAPASLTVQLNSDLPPGDDYGDIVGDEEFPSDLPAMKARKLKVVKVGVILN